MQYYILFYDYVEDYMERRTVLRTDHMVLADAAVERGELILAGATANPPDMGVLCWHVKDKAVIEEFAKNDPYVINGLVTKWTIRDWTVVKGSLIDPSTPGP